MSYNLTWTFLNEGQPDEQILAGLMRDGEIAVKCYKTFRDYAVFTNKRLIIRDVQGVMVRDLGIYSLPYESIRMWSVKSYGNPLKYASAYTELWTSAGNFHIKLHKDIDPAEFNQMLSELILK